MIKISSVFIAVILFCAFSCGRKEVTSNDQINGKFETEINQDLGLPMNCYEFILTEDTLREYQYGLLSIAKTKELMGKTIKECYWELNSKRVVVWYSKGNPEWEAISNIEWQGDDIEF